MWWLWRSYSHMYTFTQFLSMCIYVVFLPRVLGMFCSRRSSISVSSTLHVPNGKFVWPFVYMLKFMHFLKSLTRAPLLKYHNRKIIHEIGKYRRRRRNRRRHTNTIHYSFFIIISLSFSSYAVCMCGTDRNEITFRFACQPTVLLSSLMRSFTNWFSVVYLFFFFFFFFFASFVFE